MELEMTGIENGFKPAPEPALGTRADKLKLDKDCRGYHFISQAEVTIDGVNDKEEFQLTDEAFDILGFTQREKDEIYRLCAAIMHTGEMKFKQRPREEQAEADGTDEAEKACFCFGCSHEDYLKALTKPRIKVGTEWVNKGQNLEQVNWGIGAMAKGIFSRMFNYLVKKCNETLSSKKDVSKDYFIGVLDIAGFEIFDFNSFEQLWINFVNEKLQQFFNHHMFVLEQEEYQREGIHWEFIDFGLDLAATIELIEKPMGVISMLDEECIVPKASDSTYAQKLNDMHLGKHPSIEKPKPPKGKQAEAHFAIKHYAGTVRYNVTAWLEKNKDPLNDTCVAVLKSQKDNQLLLDIWSDYQTQEEQAKASKESKEGGKKKGKSASFLTVSMIYRESLNNLMTMLHTTHPHFVRCIIPNELKKSGYIDATLVMNQLTCNGVLEGIRICRKGFPNRLLHADFRFRYAILGAEEAKSSPDAKVCGEAILKRVVKEGGLSEDSFRVGHTKVFFKAGVLAQLEDLRDAKLSKLMTGLQSQARWFVQQRQVKERRAQRAGVLVVQRNIKEWLDIRVWAWFKLFGKVLPMLKQSKELEELEKLQDQITEIENNIKKEAKLREDLDKDCEKLKKEKDDLYAQMGSFRDHFAAYSERIEKLESLKTDLQNEVSKLTDKIASEEDHVVEVQKEKKRAEQELELARRRVQEIETMNRKAQTETQSKDHQIRSLREEMQQQADVITKVHKEKRNFEDMAKKLTEDLEALEGKSNHMTKLKAKLEQSLDEMQNALERERRGRQEGEKQRRKLEGDLKLAHENLDEINKQKHDLDQSVRRKEQELSVLNTRLEYEQGIVARIQKTMKELQAKVEEVQEELNSERQSRSKTEKSKSEAQRELEELSERLEEAGGSAVTQVEMNRKREAEVTKLRRDIEEARLNHENQLSLLRKKHQDTMVEMTDQLDQLNKQKTKIEKDKMAVQREIEDISSTVEAEAKAKADSEKNVRALETQISDVQAKVDNQTRELSDLMSIRGRLANENSDLNRQLEEVDLQMQNMNRMKQAITTQVDDAKHFTEDEVRERKALASQLRNAQSEVEALYGKLDEAAEVKEESLRQLQKAIAEVKQWQDRFEHDGIHRAEEMEEAKRKLTLRQQELLDNLEQLNLKITATEKSRQRLMGELDDAQVDVDRANAYASQLEKKQKGFDKLIEEWNHKCNDVHLELESSQRDNRNLSTEGFKLKNQQEEICEQIEAVQRENKAMAQEIKDLTDQLGEGGRSVHDLQKIVRRLEAKKEELQQALDEAENMLESEEGKVLRAQMEVSQAKTEIDKRLQDKEEEFDNTRKNQQRALESMQASLENEAKARSELIRAKKKLETDINDLEIALDHANRANADSQKSMKRFQEQVKELQAQLEDEQRRRDETKESLLMTEKRIQVLAADRDELRMLLENADRNRRQADADSQEFRAQCNDAQSLNQSMNAIRRRLEGEVQALHGDMEESLAELKASEELSKKAMVEASQYAEELRQEQEHATHMDRQRKALEQQIRELQTRIEEAEQAAVRGGRKTIVKLEQRIRDLEVALESEQRRGAESQKVVAKNDRSIRETQFQSDEDKKTNDRMQELVEKLQQKLRTLKRQQDEAEEIASANLQKFRAAQMQFEDAQERMEVAENSLLKIRAKTRPAIGSLAVAGLGPARSASAFVMRSPSSRNI